MWEYEYDAESDETVLYWDGEEQTRVEGRINSWKNGLPATEEARKSIRDVLQTTDHPTTVLMSYDMHFGFSDRPEQS